MVEVIGKNVYRTKIGYYDYIIKVVPKDNENLVMDDGEIHSGVTDFLTKVIYIRNDLLNDSFEYTIRHEITHAVTDSFGFLQVEWNDEILADFVAIYGKEIDKLAEELSEKINGEVKKESVYEKI